MIRFDDYKALYYIAIQKNITRAAVKLGVSQPALTKAVQRIEDELGIKLFVRSQKGVELTEDGRAVYQMIAPACEGMIEAEKLLMSSKFVEVTHISVSTNYYVVNAYVADVVLRFRELYPSVIVDVDCESSENKRQFAELGQRDVFIDYNDLWITRAEMSAFNLDVRVLTTIQDGIFVGQALHHLADKEISLRDLAEYPVILSTRENWEKKTYSELFNRMGITMKILPADGYTLKRKYAEQGLGIVITIADHAADMVKTGKWKRLNIKETLPARELALVARPSDEMSTTMRDFHDFVLEHFGLE